MAGGSQGAVAEGASGRVLRVVRGGIFRTLRFGIGEAHGSAEMMEFNYLLENHALAYGGGRYTIDYARMPAVLG